MDPITAIELASTILSALTTALPEIATDIADLKSLNATSDPTALAASIAAAHTQAMALTAKLDALKTAA